jgi:hypothetical protein
VVLGAVTRQPANPLAGGRRLARAAGLGLATYGLAVGAHVVAGGGLPGWPVTALLTALLGVLAVAFTARRRRLPALFAVLAVGQAGLHLLLSLLETRAASCVPAGGSHHAVAATCATGVASAPMLMPSLTMLVAHAAATLATAWVLARGEAWLWRTLRRAFSLPVSRAGDAPRRLGVVARFAVRWVTRWVGPDAPRGPPSGSLLLAR